jgi:hypothetical protein
MKIRFAGDQATEHQGTGVWAPGEVREVPDDVAAALLASGGWTAEDKPAEAPRRRRAASEGGE